MQISKQSYSNLDNGQIRAILAVVESTSFGCSTPRLGYQPVDYRIIPIPRIFLKTAFIVDAQPVQ
jgi:hypothetical protein